jgi:hypothetical protein
MFRCGSFVSDRWLILRSEYSYFPFLTCRIVTSHQATCGAQAAIAVIAKGIEVNGLLIEIRGAAELANAERGLASPCVQADYWHKQTATGP